MKMKSRYSFFAAGGIAVFLLFAFSMRHLNGQSTENNNRLTKEKKIGDIDIRISCRSTTALIEQELGENSGKLDKKTADSLRAKYEGQIYFLLSLSDKGREIEASNNAVRNGTFGERVQILSFRMRDYLMLTANNRDTILMTDYVYQRTLGTGGSTDLLFVYPRKNIEKADDLKFTLSDFGLGIGDVSFSFKAKDLK